MRVSLQHCVSHISPTHIAVRRKMAIPCSEPVFHFRLERVRHLPAFAFQSNEIELIYFVIFFEMIFIHAIRLILMLPLEVFPLLFVWLVGRCDGVIFEKTHICIYIFFFISLSKQAISPKLRQGSKVQNVSRRNNYNYNCFPEFFLLFSIFLKRVIDVFLQDLHQCKTK